MQAPTENDAVPPANAISLSWRESEGASSYEIFMRADGKPFQKIGAIKSTRVVKKNLESGVEHYFYVKPDNGEPSEVSAGFVPQPPTTPWVTKTFPGTIQAKTQGSTSTKVSVQSRLKMDTIIMLYMSASWCPPCKKFTPMLTTFYRSFKASHKLECVFVSCDHDLNSWSSYYEGHMPWCSIHFDDESYRSELQSRYEVSGIPRLVVLAADGTVIESNAVQVPLNAATVDAWRERADKLMA